MLWLRALVAIGCITGGVLAAAPGPKMTSAAGSNSTSFLRGGHLEVSEIHHVVSTTDYRSLTVPDENELLIMPLAFQICISAVLGIIILAQLFLTTSLVLQREKHVFEFAQPHALCVFLASSVVATTGCYLFIYISNIGCAIRDPIIFLSISIMGATVTG
jgi:hypothetical protein